MNLLKAILPPQDRKFFQYFEDSAGIVVEAADLFHEIILEFLNQERFDRALELKNRSSKLAKLTLNELNNTFVTPIDREDILHVAFLLNKITKRIVRGCVNLKVYRLTSHPVILKQQSDVLVQAAQELKTVVSLLQKSSNLKVVTESNHRMKEIEHKGDEIFFNAMDDLFSGSYNALDVIKLRDIFRSIESALDNCFNVSDTVVNVVLKHG
jgi:uncharacterized protein Yka (UPF0111/DUF47 family)